MPNTGMVELGNVVPGAIKRDKAQPGTSESYVGFIDVPSGRTKAYIKIVRGKELINEVLSAYLARAADLPVPDVYLVRVAPADLPDSDLLKQHGKEAIAIASKAVGYPDLSRRFLNDEAGLLSWLKVSWNDRDDVMVFDEWIANVDRNAGNLLLGNDGKVWLIDHGQAFTGPNWNAASLVVAAVYDNKVANSVIPTLPLPERYALAQRAHSMSATWAKVDIGLALNFSRANALVAPEEFNALGVFLAGRLAQLGALISQRVGIPMLRAGR